MRPITNLKANPEFRLSPQDRQTGFISAYNARWGMNPHLFAFRLATGVLYPWSADMEIDMDRSFKEWLNSHVRDLERRHVVKSVLKKNQLAKTIEFKAPVFYRLANSEDFLKDPGGWAYKNDIPSVGNNIEAKNALLESIQKIDDTPFAGGALVSANKVIELCKFTGKTADILRKCLMHLEGVKQGQWFIVYATWKISAKEAEYLNNVPFAQIKLGNFYPTLIDWAATCFGKDTNLPDTICPISSITAGVEALKAQGPVKPRVGIDGVVVDVHRHFYKIPDLNNAQLYEQLLLEFGTQEDGSYTWGNNAVEVDEIRVGDVNRKKLPINMPIYADWVNDKFIYSNSAGNLSVYDLSDTAPLNNFHLNALLSGAVEVAAGKGTIWSVVCNAVDLAAQWDRSILAERPTDEEVPDPNARDLLERFRAKTFTSVRPMVEDAFNIMLRSGGEDRDEFVGRSGAIEIRVHQLATRGPLKFLFRIIQKAAKAINDNLEVAYRRYSVMTVLQQSAVLELIVNHSERRDEVERADLDERDAYLTQGVDPNYEIEAVPMVKDGLRYLPHQNKTHNMMRRGPKNGVYAVDAGGGKTIIIMTNILLELKKGNCRKPIIVCPSHLVAQYVKEVVYVTEGRLNIIPVTNASLKAHGEEKLAQFINNAPINSIVVTDMNFLKGRRQNVAYGNKSIDIYRNAEFMRQFEFDLVAIDEVHYLKNFKSSRRHAAARFVMDIPMKRIASGTLVSDTILDLASQIALIDPIIFGSIEEFKREFGGETRGDKVLNWKPGAEAEVRRRIAQHCVFATARRKEWAALLPPKQERFLAVDLTKNQRLLYESILKETMDLIEEAMAKDAELREMMTSEDDSVAEELSAKLRPYLARLEKFLSAPEDDSAAQLFLKDPEDLMSPKVRKIYEICSDHLNQGIPGKVLIFTQYTASAESVYVNAPPELKKVMIHYTADRKAECKTEFENDPRKMIMVGVSQSMDTGLNLQFASRLIRMETVWTPGVLEQGNSRINRPELKKAEERASIYLDWLVINRTIDITKVGRLISKIVSKAKFDEYDNPNYAAIPDLPQVQMTLDSIAENNDFAEKLLPYLEAYQTYQQVEEEEFKAYKEAQGGNIVPVDVPQAGLLEGSKLMSRVPYIPEMELYGIDKLGLVRYDHFVRQDFSELDEDVDTDSEGDDADEGEGTDPKSLKRAAMRAARERERPMVMNRPVHTDVGDGTIVYVGNKKLRVRLADGSIILVPKMQAYIITRSTTNGIDMRNELLKQVGKIPLDKPITVPVEEGVQDKKRRKKAGQEEQLAPKESLPTAEFDFTVMNDFLALMYRGDGSDTAVVDTLQNFGFRITQPYIYTKIPGPIRLMRLMQALAAAGFTLTKDNSTELARIYQALKHNKKAMNTFGFATQMSVTNFFRADIKPSGDPNLLRIYPLVQDGMLYLMFPTKGQAANQKVRRVQVSEIQWKQSQDVEMLRLFGNKKEALDALKEMMQGGISIPESNLKELQAQFKSIKLVVR